MNSSRANALVAAVISSILATPAALAVPPAHLADEPCGGGLVVPEARLHSKPAGAAPRGTVYVDVMVAWTPSSQSNIGGGAQSATAYVRNYALATNSYFAASNVSERIRLVYAVATPYAESGSYIDNLTRLRVDNDGDMDELHPLRDQYGADLVALIADVNDVCGVAWLFGNNPDYGFSMTSVHCSSFTFAHELGHNFGCCHDRDNAGSGCTTPEAYGYRFNGVSGTQWRTIMSYAPGTRIGHFSNPNINYDGAATGTATENNAATFPVTHSDIAAYRDEAPFQDCDGNLIADAIDIASGAAQDANNDGVIDACVASCPEDLTGDGQIDLADLSRLLAHFGAAGSAADGDISGNGQVGLEDLSALLGVFGSICP